MSSRKTYSTPDPSQFESIRHPTPSTTTREAPNRREINGGPDTVTSRLHDYHPETQTEEDYSERTIDVFGEEPGGPAQENESVTAEASLDAENPLDPQLDAQTPEEDE